jgi:LPXTG-site transpeptidase (sortase) family protein
MRRILLILALIAVFSPIGEIQAEHVPMLIIPRLELVSPIGEIALVNTIWDTTNLGTGIAHLGTTGWISAGSNTVLAGHYDLPSGAPGAFYRLDQLSVGDWIWLFTADNQPHIYLITTIFDVDPSDVAVTYPEPGQTLITLITCDRFDPTTRTFTQRLIIRGVLVP